MILSGEQQAEARAFLVRDLFLSLRKFFPGPGPESSQHAISSDCFDPGTGTLTPPGPCILGPEATDADLRPFGMVLHLNGSLVLQGNTAVTRLNGFDRLESVRGDLVIRETGLEHIDDLNTLKRIEGNLVIAGNPRLASLRGINGLRGTGGNVSIAGNDSLTLISGLNSLERIESGKLEILHNPSLQSVRGFGDLQEVGGTLRLDQCRQLEDIEFLSNVVCVGNLWVNQVRLDDPSPLRKLFLANERFPGFIKITSCSLRDLSFLAGLKYVGSSLYLHNNLLEDVQGLDDLEEINASFSLAGNRICDLIPLRKLKRVNGVLSVANNSLTSLAGLESLRSLRTKKWNGTPSTLRIYGNPDLDDLSAIDAVEAVDRFFVLHLDRLQRFTCKPNIDTFFNRNIVQIQDIGSGMAIPAYSFATDENQDYRRFRTAMPNEAVECMIDFEKEADTLTVSFAGSPRDERWRMVDGIRSHKLIVADHRGLWYHGGFAGITDDLEGTLSFVRKIAAGHPYKKIICHGESAGGYMAMLTGWLIKADYVIAFSPHTCLDPKVVQAWEDNRFVHAIRSVQDWVDPAYMDLEKLFAAHPNTQTEIRLFFNEASSADRAHIVHLRDRANIRRCSYEVLDRLMAMGCAKGDALNAEAFLAFCQILDERYEFAGNEALPMAPETPEQITIATNLSAWLYNHFRNSRFRVHMADRQLHAAAAGAFLCPDVFATDAESSLQTQQYPEDAVLAVDVLSGTAMAFDRGRRFDLVTGISSLREYVTVDALSRRVRIWRRQGRQWLEYEPSAEAGLDLVSLGVAIPPAVLFANLP